MWCWYLQELNAESVIPEGFPDWVETMNGWGSKMIAAVEVGHLSTEKSYVSLFHIDSIDAHCWWWNQVVAEMAAIGFGLHKEAFTSLMFQVSWQPEPSVVNNHLWFITFPKHYVTWALNFVLFMRLGCCRDGSNWIYIAKISSKKFYIAKYLNFTCLD